MTAILPLMFVAGAVWWTFVEYVLHRFAFHKKGRYLGKRHLRHHADVTVRWLAVAPWPSAVGGAGLHVIVFVGVFGGAVGGALSAGFVAGYLVYEWVHYSTHYVPARTRFGKWLRAYHLLHHHKSPKARFGVTSPVWDLVFGTYEPVVIGRREP